ncbi:MAG: DUF3237 domain-containing protein [Pseudomonadota bacterium]
MTELKPPGSSKIDYAFAMRIVGLIGEPHQVHDTLIFNVVSSTVEGPGIKAEGMLPAGDWIHVRKDGSWKLDVRFSLMLDDGFPALVEYNGIVKMTPEQFEKGQTEAGIDVDAVYFYATPYISTDSEKYAWLNDHVFIGKIVHFGGGKVVYDIFKLV